MKKLSKEEWVNRAKEIHGDLYLYPIHKWGDISSKTLVPISCSEHGDFFQSMSNHTHSTSPTGCPICSGKVNKTRSERIHHCSTVHDDKYDYSLWPDEISAKTKVETICKTCGKHWFHNVDNHVRGRGCPNCKKEIRVKPKHDSKLEKCEKYISQAKSIHSNFYSYELIEPKFNIKSLQPILCPDHGIFYSIFYNHVVKSSECPKCMSDKMKQKHMFGYDRWVQILSEIHSNYSFRKHEDGSDTGKSRIYVTCPIHGEWECSVFSLTKHGCPSCAGQSQNMFYINSVENLCLKYGIAKNVNNRISSQNNKNPLKMKTIVKFIFDDYSSCRRCESEIKRVLSPVLTKDDLPDGWTETSEFSNMDYIINQVKKFGGIRV